MFTRLRENKLYLRLKKCSFFQTSVKYLGVIVEQGKVRADPVKVDAVREWQEPANKSQMMSFLGLAGQYRKFIHHYSTLTAPLTDMLSKDQPQRLHWT